MVGAVLLSEGRNYELWAASDYVCFHERLSGQKSAISIRPPFFWTLFKNPISILSFWGGGESIVVCL